MVPIYRKMEINPLGIGKQKASAYLNFTAEATLVAASTR